MSVFESNQQQINQDTVLVIINTLLFKDGWEKRFPKFNTKPEMFNCVDGTKVEAAFMFTKQRMNYLKNASNGNQCVRVMFQSSFSMIFCNTHHLEEGEVFKLYENEREIKLKVPKFKIESQVDVKSILEGLGHNRLFKPKKEDFQGMSGETV